MVRLLRRVFAVLVTLAFAHVNAAALDDFVRKPNLALPGHNVLKVSNATPEQCAASCRENSTWCRSFDYNKGSSYCQLSDQRDTDVGLQAYAEDPWDHYSVKQALDPLSKFTRTSNAAIFGHNRVRLSDVTPQACATACTSPQNASWCRSFDFHKLTSKCDLSDAVASEVGGVKTNYLDDPYDHYALSPAAGKPNPVPGNKHVLLIGIDGMRGDAIGCVGCVATPNLSALISGGAFHSNVVAGGSQSTYSGPGWATVFTGHWVDDHGVTGNDSALKMNRPHIFDRIKLAYPTATVGVVGDWFNITHNLAPKMPDFMSTNTKKVSQEATDLVKGWLSMANAPTAIFYYLHNVDVHKPSYDPLNAYYQSQIAYEDEQIGQVLTALKSRPNYANEEWLVVVTSDHGGLGSGHGNQSAEERRTFMILNNNYMNPGKVPYCTGDLTGVPLTQADGVTPHILDFLGMPNNTVGRKHPYC